MVFSSNVFLFVFFPICLLGYYIIGGARIKFGNYFLMLASLLFYAWGEPRFVVVMIGSIILNYSAGMLIHNIPKYKKIFLTICVIANLSVLFIYKYLGFAITNLNLIFNDTIPMINLALPIGISFFTFQAMSYVIDVYRDDVAVQKNPLYVAMYISFFPQLIAGPIVRYVDIEKEIDERSVSWDDFAAGIRLFLIGLSQKVLLANTLSVVADKAFNSAPEQLSTVFLWGGAFAYTFQIFFDFSGYSTMAIGLGRMFGFRFLENFNFPYISQSISEFWRRWHMSLGTWFRDYVYFPLGGSRVNTKLRLVFNLAVVWLLTGIWHGANWTFLVWGVLYFVLITFEKLSGYPQNFKHKASKIAYRIFTLFSVVMGWIVFRADTMSYAIRYIKEMFNLSHNFIDSSAKVYLSENAVFFFFAIMCSVPLKTWVFKDKRISKGLCIAGDIVLITLTIMSISYLNTKSVNPFIYFNF